MIKNKSYVLNTCVSEYVNAHKEVDRLEEELSEAKRNKNMLKELVVNNVRYSGHRDGDDWGIGWYVFDPMEDDKLYKILDNLDIIEYNDRGIWDENDWDCSGLTMVDAPSIKRTKTRILVTQSWCLDI